MKIIITHLIFIILLPFLIGGSLLFGGATFLNHQSAKKNLNSYPQVDGIIVAKYINAAQRDSSTRGGLIKSTRLRCKYVVGFKSYEENASSMASFYSKKSAINYLEKFKIGQKIKIYHSPKNPKHFYADTNLKNQRYESLIYFIFFQKCSASKML